MTGGSRQATRRTYGSAQPLSNRTRGGGGSVVVKLLFVALIGGAGFFGWKQFKAYMKDRENRQEHRPGPKK